MKTNVLVAMVLVVSAAVFTAPMLLDEAAAAQSSFPKFEPDPYWPKPLPNHWILGQVSGIAVDSHDHIWVATRPDTLTHNDIYASFNPPEGDCCLPSPPIVEFDQAGNMVQAWGGKGDGFQWPTNEHGIYVDNKDNVWLTGNATGGGGGRGVPRDPSKQDTTILKFTKNGKFLMQIGQTAKTFGSNDTTTVNRVAEIVVYPKTNELFVADGYGNRRVIVFDADSGAYKRHWGAYGNKPDDSYPQTRSFEGPGSQQFNIVHSVKVANDDLVYVADRVNNRVQVFKLDGTFVKEAYVQRKTLAGPGSAFSLAFSPDKPQRFLYVVDGSNNKVHILNRESLEKVGEIIGSGGHGYADFFHIHSIAVNSKGDMFLGETFGERAVRYNFKGIR